MGFFVCGMMCRFGYEININYCSGISNVYPRPKLERSKKSNKKINPDLELYVTEKTINGLFYILAEEEIEIRKNPQKRTTDLLKKVFGN